MTTHDQQRAAHDFVAPGRTTTTTSKLAIPVYLYLAAVVLPIGFNLGPLVLTSLRLLLMALIVPLGVKLLMGKYGRIFLTDIVFFIFILWMAVSIGKNNPSQMVQQVGSVGAEFLGGYVVGRAYIRNSADFLKLCKALIFCAILTTPLAVFETLTGRSIFIEALRKVPGIITVPINNYDPRLGLERVQATFAHPIHYGLVCSIIFSLSFVAMKGVVGTARRYISSILIAGSGFLALSSGALLAIALQFALIVWATVFANFRYRWWFLVGLFVVAYIAIDILSNRTPIKVFMSYATFSAHNAYMRAIIFDWGMQNFWTSPLFGIGLNDWFRPAFVISGSMDNFWLVIAVRYGFPGFILLVVGYVLPIFYIMRRNFEANERLTLIRKAWIFTFLGLTFTLCTVHVWTNIFSFVFFMFGAGFWLIEAPVETEGTDKNLKPNSRRQGIHRVQSSPGDQEPTRDPSSGRPIHRYSRF